MSRNGKKAPRKAVMEKALLRRQVKEREKVAEHVHRLQQLKAGDESPHIQDLNRQMAALLKGHNELVTAFNGNIRGFADSIQHLDSRVGALAMVLDDLVRKGPEGILTLPASDLKNAGPDHPAVGGVHWPKYISMYLKQIEGELQQLRERQDAAKAVQLDPLITPPELVDEDEEPVVFGGKEDDVQDSPRESTGTEG